MEIRRPFNPLLAGAVAGLVGTVPQTLAMEAVRRAMPTRFPPRQVVEGVLTLVTPTQRPPRISEGSWKTITTISHFGYGATVGSLYTLMPRTPKQPIIRGVIFGLLVWATSYGAVLPLLGITRPQADHPVRKNLQLVAAHLAWGAVTASLFNWLTSRSATKPV